MIQIFRLEKQNFVGMSTPILQIFSSLGPMVFSTTVEPAITDTLYSGHL